MKIRKIKTFLEQSFCKHDLIVYQMKRDFVNADYYCIYAKCLICERKFTIYKPK